MNKKEVIRHLVTLFDEKIVELRENYESLTEARNNEDKCTVGDKYETGRVMAQMELEKAEMQLLKTEEMKTALSRIDLKTKLPKVEFGALVETCEGYYFFCIPFGKIEIENENVFCLSPVSPIGKILSGKKSGEKVGFQGKEIEILSIN